MNHTIRIEIPVNVSFSARLEETQTVAGPRSYIIIEDIEYSDSAVLDAVTEKIYTSDVKTELSDYAKILKLIDEENQAEIKYQSDHFKDF